MNINPLAIELTLLTHLIIFEDPQSPDPDKHPSDPSRIQKALAQQAARFPALKTANSQLSLSLASIFLPGGTHAYQALDIKASRVTRQSLRVWRGKPG
jgi:hypothetical protein